MNNSAVAAASSSSSIGAASGAQQAIAVSTAAITAPPAARRAPRSRIAAPRQLASQSFRLAVTELDRELHPVQSLQHLDNLISMSVNVSMFFDLSSCAVNVLHPSRARCVSIDIEPIKWNGGRR